MMQHGTLAEFKARYTLGKELGSGATAGVREVYDAERNKFAAKIIRKETMEDVTCCDAVNEVTLMKELQGSRNIVRMYDTYETETSLIIVMDLVGGMDMADYVEERDTLDESQLANVMKNLFSALTDVHSRDIVHCDIKPENIILKDEHSMSTTLVDFGTCQRLDGDSKLVKLVGTPEYLAPEIILTKKGDADGYTAAVDVWAAGVTAYVLVTAEFPFWNEHKPTMIKSITEAEYEVPRGLSGECIDFLAKCLDPNPETRMSASELLNHAFILMHTEHQVEEAEFTAVSSEVPSPIANMCGEPHFLAGMNSRPLPISAQ